MLLAWSRRSSTLWGSLTRIQSAALQLVHNDQCNALQPYSASWQHAAHTAPPEDNGSRHPLWRGLDGAAAAVAAYDSFSSRALHTSPYRLARQQERQQAAQQAVQQPTGDGEQQAGGSGGTTGSSAATAATAAAAPAPTWVDSYLPKSWAPYAHLMRLDKPIGTWLLAWPCFWSIALAAPPGTAPDLHTLALFGTGAVLLRGAGCTVNDLWDRDLDKQVERTRGRPLAAGLITPPQAIAFLGAQLLAGLGILVQLNWYSQLLGASSLALVATYPLMKRVTGWPQAFLGLTYNWGALLGWAAVRGSCDWGVVGPLYLAGVSWTLVYDTIYAHQDKEDDVKAGIKSTALTFGAATKPYLAGFSALSASLLGTAGYMAGCGVPYYAGVAAAAGHLAWQVSSVDLDDRADCWDKFASNKWTGALVFGGIVADRLLG